MARPRLERALFWLCAGLLMVAMIKGTPVDPLSTRIRDSLPDGYFRLGPISAFIGGDARFLSDWLLGLLFAACIFLSRQDRPATARRTPIQSVVQVCSSYTFSLYLYHVPVLVFAHAVLSPRMPAAAVPWAMLVAILLVTAVLGRYTEHRKEPWVRAFNAMLGRQARSSA